MFDSKLEFTPTPKGKRGVGYCQNPACDDFGKGVFCLNAAGRSQCPECRFGMHMEMETFSVAGDTSDWCSVRVEYNFSYVAYNKVEKLYRDIAILKDMSVGGDLGVYTLHSPLIRTKERALKVAEQVFSTLLIQGFKGQLITPLEDILVMDGELDQFKRQLMVFEKDRLSHR